MRNIKLILQYDGTGYCGWQSQRKGEKTIQSAVEDCIHKILGRKPNLLSSGRTDSGVHAIAHPASFKTTANLPCDAIMRAMNATLPVDIRVMSAEDTLLDFHPRFDAVSKTYAYVISNSEVLSPFAQGYVWHIQRPLDTVKMRRASSGLVGSHDFMSFMASGSSAKNTVKTITGMEILKSDSMKLLGLVLEGRFIIIRVEGDGFLRHMVRNIVGTLVDIGLGRLGANAVEGILGACDRSKAGPTAPACGLFLECVRYG